MNDSSVRRAVNNEVRCQWSILALRETTIRVELSEKRIRDQSLSILEEFTRGAWGPSASSHQQPVSPETRIIVDGPLEPVDIALVIELERERHRLSDPGVVVFKGSRHLVAVLSQLSRADRDHQRVGRGRVPQPLPADSEEPPLARIWLGHQR
jgi:hypothetical protein